MLEIPYWLFKFLSSRKPLDTRNTLLKILNYVKFGDFENSF